MERATQRLKTQVQCVCGMSFKIIPDLLGRIKLRRVFWEKFNMKAWIIGLEFSDNGSRMNLSVVPENDDRTMKVTEELPNEFADMRGLEILLLEAEVKAHVFA